MVTWMIDYVFDNDLEHTGDDGYVHHYESDDDVTFYYLKNDTLTNCQLEDIGFYLDMGVEFTIQDTSEVNGSS